MPSFHKFIGRPSKGRLDAANSRAKRIQDRSANPESMNFNHLNDLFYKGREDRLVRYRVYDTMDDDLDVARALDIISEYCTGKSEKTNSSFIIDFEDEEMSQEDMDLIYQMLRSWIKINDWDNRLFRAVRNTVKYGDMFYVRDPQTYKLITISPKQVLGVYVDEDTNEIKAYHLVNLNFSLNFLRGDIPFANNPGGHVSMYQHGAPIQGTAQGKHDLVVPADYVIHLSLSEGQETGGNGQADDLWPFGMSFLENVFKTFKQRSLLEDAALIHRIQRAPSRRVWHIDVGKMRPDKAEAYIRKFKLDLMQKQAPNKFGGGDAIDSVYNPISQLDDFFLPQSADGRGSKVENLEGQQWPSAHDLEYFTSKILRGLRVPVSFMLGPEEGGASFKDGQVGTAYIQEQQFAKFCERIQAVMDNNIDNEFKLYLKARGLDINASDFQLKFVPPMNFDVYRETALTQERLNVFQSVIGVKFISKYIALRDYLGWDDEKIAENMKYWAMENRKGAAAGEINDNATSGLGGFGGGFGSMGGFGDGMDMGPESGGIGGPGGENGGMGGGELGGAGAGGVGFGGSGAPAGGGFGAGTESSNSKHRDGLFLVEDAVPVSKQYDSGPDVPNEDRLFGDDDHRGKPKLSLRHIRQLRIKKEKDRLDMLKRLDIMGRMYGPSEESGLGF